MELDEARGAVTRILNNQRRLYGGGEVTPEVVDAWLVVLGDIPADVLEFAAVEVWRTHQSIPTPAVYRQTALLMQLGIPTESEALAMLEGALHGEYERRTRSQQALPPFVRQIAGRLGGFAKLRTMERDAWTRKFGPVYRDMVKEVSRGTYVSPRPALDAGDDRPTGGGDGPSGGLRERLAELGADQAVADRIVARQRDALAGQR